MRGLKNKNEKGAVVIVEATFVFPIMVFVLFFLLFYCNAMYVRSNVDACVSSAAISAAAEISDPLLSSVVKNGKVPAGKKGGSEPYRYIFNSYGNSVAKKYSNGLKAIKFGGVFSRMVPNNIKVTYKYNNLFLYQSIRFEVTYQVKFPIRMIFVSSPTIMKFTSADEAPINDSSEFVLNTNMVLDYYESTGLKDKVDGFVLKIKDFFNKK